MEPLGQQTGVVSGQRPKMEPLGQQVAVGPAHVLVSVQHFCEKTELQQFAPQILVVGHSQAQVVSFCWTNGSEQVFGHSHWQVVGLRCVLGGAQGPRHWPWQQTWEPVQHACVPQHDWMPLDEQQWGVPACCEPGHTLAVLEPHWAQSPPDFVPEAAHSWCSGVPTGKRALQK